MRSAAREETLPDYWFEPTHWGEAERVGAGGRGAAWFVANGDQRFVLRRFRRGGLVGKVLTDQYFAARPEDSRAIREFVLLDRLHCLGLPVP